MCAGGKDNDVLTMFACHCGHINIQRRVSECNVTGIVALQHLGCCKLIHCFHYCVTPAGIRWLLATLSC